MVKQPCTCVEVGLHGCPGMRAAVTHCAVVPLPAGWDSNSVSMTACIHRNLQDVHSQSVCRNLKAAGFETFWEVLQYYPKDFIVYQPYLQSGGFVQLQGTITKSSVGGPYLQLQVQVDPIHNPLLNPPEPIGILAPTEMTDLDNEAAAQTDDEVELHIDDDESFDDESHSGSFESSTSSELNEHGRSIVPEEASTSSVPLSHPASSSPQPAACLEEQQAGQQTLEVKQFFGGKFGRYGASKLAMAHPVGGRVRVHCKVSPGSAPGKTLWCVQCIFLL